MIIGVCTTLVVLALVAIIIVFTVVYQALKPRFVIDHFTAELQVFGPNAHKQILRRVVFDDKHSYLEYMYKKEAKYVYFYCNGNVCGLCRLVGGHSNCVARYDASGESFSVSNLFSMTQEVECPSISDPELGGKKRNLTKCDKYDWDYTDPDTYTPMHKTIWTESETNYPVKDLVLKEQNQQWVEDSATEYTSFDPDMPTDRTRTNPTPRVKVWDMRVGKEGIYDSGNSTVEEVPWYASVMNALNKEKINRNVLMAKQFSFFASMGPAIGEAPARGRFTREAIPESFDSRTYWGKCSVISEITDQNPCGSCWAMSSSATLADRICIATNGSVNVALSPQYMLNCFTNQQACNGGWDEPVWHDLMEIGTVPNACVPFKARLGSCTQQCEDGTPIPNRVKAKSFYSPWGDTDSERVEAIQREIMEHGPVSASYYAFNDFEPHKWSIYHRSKSASKPGGHVVRLIGWGTENGEDYWLAANSWGDKWGDDGFFKIRRGNNECNIEEAVIAGEPLLN